MSEIDLRTKEDLVRALEALKEKESAFWRAIDPDRFARAFGEAWSPADNVRHLIKSTTPVTFALKLPKVALTTLFGKGNGRSVTYGDLVGRYHEALAKGGKAGRYAPSPLRPSGDLRAWQETLVTRCESAIGALAREATSWNEEDLDRCRLPHPLLGKLTVREMLFSTLYHHEHHRMGVAKRLKEQLKVA